MLSSPYSTLAQTRPSVHLICKASQSISSAAIWRWLCLTIQDAGINTDFFKAYSVRSASTTVAANGSVSLDENMKMAD